MILLAALFAAAGISEPTAVTPPPVAPSEKIHCKTELVTGSLVRSNKECHTVAEWEAIRRDAQDAGRRMTAPGFFNRVEPGG